MRLTIEPASEAAFRERAKWRYEPPYDVYDPGDKPVKNPERHFAARDGEGALVGFYYFEQEGDAIRYGLALRPELTGRGLGPDFFDSGVEFARRRFKPARIVLDAAAFNERAIKVYERAGFRVTGRHLDNLAGEQVEFVDMERVL